MATNTLSKRPAEDTAFFTFLAALPQSSCTLAHFLAASKDIYISVFPNHAHTPANATIFMTSVSVCAQQGQ